MTCPPDTEIPASWKERGLTRDQAYRMLDRVAVQTFGADDLAPVNNFWNVWRSWFWLEQGRHGWNWWNWGNMHAFHCEPNTPVQGHVAIERLRAFRSPQEGMAANVALAISHMGRRDLPAEVRADLLRGLDAADYSMPIYNRMGRNLWVTGSWHGSHRVSKRVLGTTDRLSGQIEVEADADAARWTTTVAHELAHWALARIGGYKAELSDEERRLESISRSLEAAIQANGVGSRLVIRGHR